MRDNTTSQPAACYDNKITMTIPFYYNIIEASLDIVKAVHPGPRYWLDSGCGTGNLVMEAAKHFEKTHFTLADPSGAMIACAREKLGSYENRMDFIQEGTEEISLPTGKYEVITAIISHHYFNSETRKKATRNCFDLLADGGIYINVETIMPLSEESLILSIKRWRNAQVKAGKTTDEVDHHLSRFGSELKPITIFEHLDLLKICKFSYVDLFWLTNMQAGFYAIK